MKKERDDYPQVSVLWMDDPYEIDFAAIYGDEAPSLDDASFLLPETEVENVHDPFRLPEPRSAEPLLSPEAWRLAEQAGASRLAEACELIGNLDATLRLITPKLALRDALRRRILVRDLELLAWLNAPSLNARRLALSLADALPASDDSHEASVRFRIASAYAKLVRPSASPVSPEDFAKFASASAADVAGEGSPWREPTLRDLPPPRGAADQYRRFEELAVVLGSIATLTPLTRAAAALALWRGLEIDRDPASVDAYVLAAQIGVQKGRGGLVSLPIMPASSRPFVGGLEPAVILPHFFQSVRDAVARSLIEVERAALWRDRAVSRQNRRGGVVMAVIDALTCAPIASVASLRGLVGAPDRSIAAAVASLEADRLVREVTGGRRYRFWTICVDSER